MIATFRDFLKAVQSANGDFKNLKSRSTNKKLEVYHHFRKYVREIREFRLISAERLKLGKISQIFFKFPKFLLFKEPYCFLSSDAKLVYMLLLDQLNRSIGNGWFGKWNGERAPYVKYKQSKLCFDLCISSSKTIVEIMRDLEMIGLIRRQPTPRGDMVFLGEIYSDKAEEKVAQKPKPEPEVDFSSHKTYRILEKYPEYCVETFGGRMPFHLSEVDRNDVDFDDPDTRNFDAKLFEIPEDGL